MPSEFWSKSLLGEWSENSFFALKALFRGRGVQWVGGGAGCLWEVFWTAHGRRRTQRATALKVEILMATLPGTANDALGHHLCNNDKTAKNERKKHNNTYLSFCLMLLNYNRVTRLSYHILLEPIQLPSKSQQRFCENCNESCRLSQYVIRLPPHGRFGSLIPSMQDT